MSTFKPMLAPGQSPATYPKYFEELRYPLMCSPKLDGIRCIVKGGCCLSRTGKLLPSKQVQEMFGALEHYDGEIIVGDVTAPNVYNLTQSHVMSEDKPAEKITFYAFDYTHPNYLELRFDVRLSVVSQRLAFYEPTTDVVPIKHQLITSKEALEEYEAEMLELGYEGIMMRDPLGRYKNGRGTFKEGLIYKLKRFEDTEAYVIGFVEQQHNTNPQERSELGYAKRSSAKTGLVGAGTLGRFIVDWDGTELDIAPGNFNHEERQYIWNNQEKFLGQILTIRYFSYGVKDKPRFPRAVGFRYDLGIL